MINLTDFVFHVSVVGSMSISITIAEKCVITVQIKIIEPVGAWKKKIKWNNIQKRNYLLICFMCKHDFDGVMYISRISSTVCCCDAESPWTCWRAPLASGVRDVQSVALRYGACDSGRTHHTNSTKSAAWACPLSARSHIQWTSLTEATHSSECTVSEITDCKVSSNVSTVELQAFWKCSCWLIIYLFRL